MSEPQVAYTSLHNTRTVNLALVQCHISKYTALARIKSIGIKLLTSKILVHSPNFQRVKPISPPADARVQISERIFTRGYKNRH